eukprot:267-Hanusia_phi.AAC.2
MEIDEEEAEARRSRMKSEKGGRNRISGERGAGLTWRCGDCRKEGWEKSVKNRKGRRDEKRGGEEKREDEKREAE